MNLSSGEASQAVTGKVQDMGGIKVQINGKNIFISFTRENNPLGDGDDRKISGGGGSITKS